MSKKDNIFLIGPMGVGKTTIGKKLAKRLDKTFIDSDREIERRTGATINLIFDVEGEAGFRARESRALEELSTRSDIVLATGGGIILAGENRTLLQERGIVIYLAGSPELLLKRTAYDNSRPLLAHGDRLVTIKSLLAERQPIYSALADREIRVDKLSSKRIINQICDYVEQYAQDNR